MFPDVLGIMWTIWTIIATAQAVDLSDWAEVRPLPANATTGVLNRDHCWARGEDQCLKVTVDRVESSAFLTFPLCSHVSSDGYRVRCTQHGVGILGEVPGTECTWVAPDGTEGSWSAPPSYGSHHSNRLVVSTPDHAEWRDVVQLGVALKGQRRSQRPCTPQSLEALGPDAPADGRRTCVESNGLEYFIVPVGVGRLAVPSRWPTRSLVHDRGGVSA